MSKPGQSKWTLELIREVASKYSSRKEFQNNDRGAYEAAYRFGCIDEVCSHMKKPERKREELVGKTFNSLTVLEYLGINKTKNNIYKVKCVCGKEKVLEGSDVKTGKVQSCGCRRYITQLKENTIWKSIFRDYKVKAKKRSYEFNINQDDFINLIKLDCHYCGAEPSNRKVNRYHFVDETIFYNGLDRVDNTKGYSVDNCVPCCKFCNQAKHGMTKEFFLDWVERVHRFQNKK